MTRISDWYDPRRGDSRPVAVVLAESNRLDREARAYPEDDALRRDAALAWDLGMGARQAEGG